MPVSISGDGAITGLELEAFEDVDVGSGASDGDVLTYDASGDLWIPQGIVLPAGIGSNVVQAVKTDTFSTTLATFSDVTGVTLSITPTSAASKVLVICTGHVGTGSGTNSRLRLVRNSTNIGIATGGTVQDTQHHFINGVTDSGVPFNITFLDSPGVATATTYKLTVASGSGGSTVYVGRSGGVDRRSITTITAIEVAV